MSLTLLMKQMPTIFHLVRTSLSYSVENVMKRSVEGYSSIRSELITGLPSNGCSAEFWIQFWKEAPRHNTHNKSKAASIILLAVCGILEEGTTGWSRSRSSSGFSPEGRLSRNDKIAIVVGQAKRYRNSIYPGP